MQALGGRTWPVEVGHLEKVVKEILSLVPSSHISLAPDLPRCEEPLAHGPLL